MKKLITMGHALIFTAAIALTGSLDAIRAAFPCPRLRIADRGLREGMLVQMMREDGLMRTA